MTDKVVELKAQLDELAARMKPAHIVMANALVEGKTQEQAYKEAGFKGKNANSCSNDLIASNPSITEFVQLTKKLAYETSLPKQIGTLEQKREMLWAIAQKASVLKAILKGSEDDEGEGGLEIFDATAAKTAVAAISELNKMDGHLAAIKTDNKTATTIGFRLNLAGKSK